MNFGIVSYHGVAKKPFAWKDTEQNKKPYSQPIDPTSWIRKTFFEEPVWQLPIHLERGPLPIHEERGHLFPSIPYASCP
jgi:hypothetical protein